MADYKFTQDIPGYPPNIMVTATIMAKDAAGINADLPQGLPEGTIIHTVGYAAMKQKGLDGSWTTI